MKTIFISLIIIFFGSSLASANLSKEPCFIIARHSIGLKYSIFEVEDRGSSLYYYGLILTDVRFIMVKKICKGSVKFSVTKGLIDYKLATEKKFIPPARLPSLGQE